MIRGEVWWAELGGDAGYRPVAIVSRSDDLVSRVNVTVAEVTRTVRRIPAEVRLTAQDGMPQACVINANNIHTIPKQRLRRRIIMLDADALYRLSEALRYSLELW